MNVQQAMESAYGDSGYGFVVQYFGAQLGYELITLDGITSQNGSDEYLFWQLSINGDVAHQGIDETELNDGDLIGWNYTRYIEEQHGKGRRGAIRQRVIRTQR